MFIFEIKNILSQIFFSVIFVNISSLICSPAWLIKYDSNFDYWPIFIYIHKSLNLNNI